MGRHEKPIERGTQPGVQVYLDSLLDVDTPAPGHGDIIRFNTVTGQWESCSEPFIFKKIVLNPQAVLGDGVEGTIEYNSVDDAVYVATE